MNLINTRSLKNLFEQRTRIIIIILLKVSFHNLVTQISISTGKIYKLRGIKFVKHDHVNGFNGEVAPLRSSNEPSWREVSVVSDTIHEVANGCRASEKEFAYSRGSTRRCAKQSRPNECA